MLSRRPTPLRPRLPPHAPMRNGARHARRVPRPASPGRRASHRGRTSPLACAAAASAVAFVVPSKLHYIPMLSNSDVAQKLLEIRTLMEMAGDSFYKYMAYEKAAASVENAPPLRDLVA